MIEKCEFDVIDGIKCYHPDRCERYTDYPLEGFDVTEELEEKSFWCRSRNRLLKNLILRFRRPTGNTQFLEIGCGTGFFLRELAPEHGLETTGSEMYLRGLRYARAKSPDVEFIQLDATAIPFRDQYDIVGAFDVIEHIDDDRAVLVGVHRALRAGGHFVVTVPQYMFLWSPLDELVRHKRRYSRTELLSKLRAAGFQIVYASSFVFVLFPLMLLSRILDRRSPPAEDPRAAFESRVKLPGVLNWMFDRLMRIDEGLVRLGFSLPVGGSLLVVARKPQAG